MRFRVRRTSQSYRDGPKPCPEAVEISADYWDKRTFGSFAEYETKLGESFFAQGSDHEETPRGIRRLKGEVPAWVVYIDSLEELCDFQRRHGDLVLTEPIGAKGEPDDPIEIEIYDDYRE